jgi:hypothetical protein
MPRSNRYILAGYIYHLTHRCHNCGANYPAIMLPCSGNM